MTVDGGVPTDGGAPAPPSAWLGEPPPSSEGEWTPGGEGWAAWNQHSPEREFAEFTAALVRLVRPALVVETGVGQGFTTRRVLDALDGSYIGYESDAGFRDGLRELDVWGEDILLAEQAEPTPQVMRRCELAILDSAPTNRRKREIDLWRRVAPAGAFVLVHDVRPDHPRGRSNGVHRSLARHVRRMGGTLLGNPRGGWLARK